MIEHVRRELPNEACGLMAGHGVRVEQLYTMQNAEESPVAYRVDPQEQLAAFDNIDERGWELVGIYHSHTHTEAYPSGTDRRQAFYPEAHYVVVSVAGGRSPVVRAFTIREGEVEEQELRRV